MGELDDKLREILKNTVIRIYNDATFNESKDSIYVQDKAIAQIKQAFADEVTPLTDDIKHKLDVMESRGYMTGQEWYDRFYKEVMEMDGSLWADKTVFEAAKKASGL